MRCLPLCSSSGACRFRHACVSVCLAVPFTPSSGLGCFLDSSPCCRPYCPQGQIDLCGSAPAGGPAGQGHLRSACSAGLGRPCGPATSVQGTLRPEEETTVQQRWLLLQEAGGAQGAEGPQGSLSYFLRRLLRLPKLLRSEESGEPTSLKGTNES